VLLVALAVGIVVAAGAQLEHARTVPEHVRRAGTRIVAIAMALIVVAGLAGGLAVLGDPAHRVRTAWHEFKQVGAPNPGATGHISAGFGGARYDYYRVALDVWRKHPLAGVGAGNFSEDYIQRGRVNERPTSPHSIEFGTLVETGVVGAILLLVALGAGFAAAGGAMRRALLLDHAAAAGGLLACAYWLGQTSADWLWEFPALGGAAFAFLGLAAGAGERRAVLAPVAKLRGRITGALAAVVAVAALLSLLAPWAADIEVRRAADSWAKYPDAAFRQLDRAASYNKLSERPGLLAGGIAIQLGRYGRAESAFRQVLDRDPRNLSATISLAGLASHAGRRAQALRLLRHALVLAPGDQTATNELARARTGRLDPRQVAFDLVANAAARVH
jgi:hypothetical protein